MSGSGGPDWPDCPVCGGRAVAWKRQLETHEYPGRGRHDETRLGEARYVCARGHYFDENGEDRGTSMPPDVTIVHNPGW